MSGPLHETRAAVKELRTLVEAFETDSSSAATPEASQRVRQGLINLRRAHAALRSWQGERQVETMKAVKRLKSSRSNEDNSAFMHAQCDALVESYNSVQFPELDKVLPSLPSVEEYTEKHKMDQDFVSHDSNPHQFMLNMLADEISDRSSMEEVISELKLKRVEQGKVLAEKQKFIESIGTRLADLSRAVDSIKAEFGLGESPKQLDTST
jgi:hypothetical protein